MCVTNFSSQPQFAIYFCMIVANQQSLTHFTHSLPSKETDCWTTIPSKFLDANTQEIRADVGLRWFFGREKKICQYVFCIVYKVHSWRGIVLLDGEILQVGKSEVEMITFFARIWEWFRFHGFLNNRKIVIVFEGTKSSLIMWVNYLRNWGLLIYEIET